MSVAEIDLTGLEGPDLPVPDGAREAPAPGARRSLTGLAPRRAPAVSRLRREARDPEPRIEPDAGRAGGSAQPPARDHRGSPPARPDQGGPRTGQGGRPPVDPRTGAPVQGRGAPTQVQGPVSQVPGRAPGSAPGQARAPQQGAPGTRGPVVRRPPPGYRPGQVPVRQRPAGPAAPQRGREAGAGGPVGPAGAPMAPAAQAALAQAAAARAAMAAQTAPPPAPTAPVDDTLPRYLQLVRKEARVRSDQAEWMALEVRRINSSRRRRDGVVGERITDNTLIRVALDLLRAQGAALEGTTEDELTGSVLGLPPG